MARVMLVSLFALVLGALSTFLIVRALTPRTGTPGTAEVASEAREAPREAVARPNVPTSFNASIDKPEVKASAWIDPMSSVIGAVQIGERVYVGPFASIRGDEGQPIRIGDDANIQDGVVVHALETQSGGHDVEGRTYAVGSHTYAVYIGERVSVAHQALVHGPARIDSDVFVGMQALIFKSRIGAGSVVEPAAKVIGVAVPPGRFVPAGMVLTSQDAADALPAIQDDYPYRTLNEAVVHVNTGLATGYGGESKEPTATPAGH